MYTIKLNNSFKLIVLIIQLLLINVTVSVYISYCCLCSVNDTKDGK